MRTLWKTAAVAFALGALSVAAPANAQDYGQDNGYGPPQDYYSYQDRANECEQQAQANGYSPDDAYRYCLPDDAVPYDEASGGYCDQYGCPGDYYDLPVYYGPVFYGDTWYTGPLYYRDWYGGRQYWLHGGWHNDQWRGRRPSWWDASRYHVGPALGRNFYQGRGFHDGYGGGHVFNRGGWNGNGGRFNGNVFNNGQSGSRFGGALDRREGLRDGRGEQNSAPQVSGSGSAGHSWNNGAARESGNSSWSGKFRSGGGGDFGGKFRSSRQSAPQQSAPAPQAAPHFNNGGGRSFGGGDHGGGRGIGGGQGGDHAGGGDHGGRGQR